jgi:hypothetical protein
MKRHHKGTTSSFLIRGFQGHRPDAHGVHLGHAGARGDPQQGLDVTHLVYAMRTGEDPKRHLCIGFVAARDRSPWGHNRVRGGESVQRATRNDVRNMVGRQTSSETLSVFVNTPTAQRYGGHVKISFTPVASEANFVVFQADEVTRWL